MPQKALLWQISEKPKNDVFLTHGSEVSVLGFLSQLFWCEERQEVKLLGKRAWQPLGNKEKVWSDQFLHPCSPLTPSRLNTFSIASTSTLGLLLFLSLWQNAWSGGFRKHGLIAVGYVWKLPVVVPERNGGQEHMAFAHTGQNKDVRRYISSFLPPLYSATDLNPWGRFSSTRV